MFIRHLSEYIRLYAIRPLRCAPAADLYYLHSFHQFPAVYWLCLRHRATFIYDAHDFYSEMHDQDSLSHFWRHWVLPMERFIERRCIRHATAVVTVNEGIAGLIERRYGRSAVVLRNSHDSRLERPVAKTMREVIGLSAADFLVVSVGQFKQGMAVEHAIRAMGLLPARYHLAFLGGGYPRFEALLAEVGVTERIHFHPAVAPSAVVPFIRSADAGMSLYFAVSPSIENCLPNGFFQVLAAELPLLYPRLPEILRVADQHEIGLPIEPQNPESIAASIRKFDDDPTLTGRIQMNLELIRDFLSWEFDEARLKLLVENFIGPSSNITELAGRDIHESIHSVA